MNHRPGKKPNSICRTPPAPGSSPIALNRITLDQRREMTPTIWDQSSVHCPLALKDRNKTDQLSVHVTFTHVIETRAGEMARTSLRSYDQSTAEPGFEHKSSCSKDFLISQFSFDSSRWQMTKKWVLVSLSTSSVLDPACHGDWPLWFQPTPARLLSLRLFSDQAEDRAWPIFTSLSTAPRS